MLAGRAVGHVVVELETSVKLGGDGEGVDGEVLLVVAGVDARSGGLVMSALARDGAAGRAKGASAQEAITLAKVVLAAPALEVAAAVVADGTSGHVAPVPAMVLLLGTVVVVGVAGAAEGLGIGPRVSKVVLREEVSQLSFVQDRCAGIISKR